MRSEHVMHRNKPFITNNTPQGLHSIVMGHHRETHIHTVLHTAADTAMVMEASVSATWEEVPCLS